MIFALVLLLVSLNLSVKLLKICLSRTFSVKIIREGKSSLSYGRFKSAAVDAIKIEMDAGVCKVRKYIFVQDFPSFCYNFGSI